MIINQNYCCLETFDLVLASETDKFLPCILQFLLFGSDGHLLILQLLVAGGGMDVEVFNRGAFDQPTASRRKTEQEKQILTWMVSIRLFTYFTRPKPIAILEAMLKTDDVSSDHPVSK